MYDELVNRLREVADEVDNDYDVDPYNAEQRCLAILQAVDAIEDLSKQNENWEEALKNALDFIPCWIPVTERLPEHGWYLAYGPTIKMEVLHFHSVEKVWSSERYYNIEVTHWMPLPQPPKEET